MWWGGKVEDADGLRFPKPAFLTNSCVYTKAGDREGEKGQCPGDDITLSCLLQLQPGEQDEVGGENYSRLALGCSHVHVFIRYIIFRLSKLLPPLSSSQSD